MVLSFFLIVCSVLSRALDSFLFNFNSAYAHAHAHTVYDCSKAILEKVILEKIDLEKVILEKIVLEKVVLAKSHKLEVGGPNGLP